MTPNLLHSSKARNRRAAVRCAFFSLLCCAAALFTLASCGGGGSGSSAANTAGTGDSTGGGSVTKPVAPTGVSATAGDGKATITWSSVAAATSYSLYWGTSPGVTPANGHLITPVASPCTQTNLTNGTTYHYVVTAVNEGGESPASAEVNATPQVSAPEAPGNISAREGDGQVTVSWSSVAGSTSYDLYWSTSPGVTPANGTRIGSVTSPYVHTGVSNGTTYYYVVIAVDAGGESPASVEVSATPQVSAPAAPVGVSASPGDGQVTVKWNNVTGATSYDLYWSTSPGVTPATVTRVADVLSPYTHTGLVDGSTYYYVVTAVNNGGESPASAEVNATPQVPAPGAPTGVSASPGDGNATITWNSVVAATGYNLYWGTSPGVNPANGHPITDVASPYVHTGLTDGTAYYYVVTAVDAGGEGPGSAEVNATPLPPPPPGAPSGVAASPGAGQTTISWNTVAGATSYNLYWGTSPGVSPANGHAIEGATSPYTHTGLTDGTAYYYIVTAVGVGGESAASNQVSATPQAVTPGAPTSVAANAGDGQVSVSWSGVSGATSYNLYWSTSPGVTTVTGTEMSAVQSPYVHSGLTNGTTYYYVVAAVDADGEGPASAEASATPRHTNVPPVIDAVEISSVPSVPQMTIEAGTYSVYVKASDVDGDTLTATVKINGSPHALQLTQNADGPFEGTLADLPIANGEGQTVEVDVSDSQAVTSQTIQLTGQDTLSPVISVVAGTGATMTNGGTLNGIVDSAGDGVAQFFATVTDASPTTNTYRVNGGAWQSLPADGRIPLTLAGWVNVVVDIQADDGINTPSDFTVTVHPVDSIAPTLQIRQGGANGSSTGAVSLLAGDSDLFCLVAADNQAVFSVSIDDPQSQSWLSVADHVGSTLTFASGNQAQINYDATDGIYCVSYGAQNVGTDSLAAEATDVAGNQVTDAVQITVQQNQPPTFNLFRDSPVGRSDPVFYYDPSATSHIQTFLIGNDPERRPIAYYLDTPDENPNTFVQLTPTSNGTSYDFNGSTGTINYDSITGIYYVDFLNPTSDFTVRAKASDGFSATVDSMTFKVPTMSLTDIASGTAYDPSTGIQHNDDSNPEIKATDTNPGAGTDYDSVDWYLSDTNGNYAYFTTTSAGGGIDINVNWVGSARVKAIYMNSGTQIGSLERVILGLNTAPENPTPSQSSFTVSSNSTTPLAFDLNMVDPNDDSPYC